MKEVLIATVSPDLHATVVEVALQKLGITYFKWITSELPSYKTCFQCGTGVSAGLQTFDRAYDLSTLTNVTLWNRRITSHVSARDDLAPGDKIVSEREFMALLHSTMHFLDKSSRRINGYGNSLRAESKIVQLQAAMAANLCVPPTLVTNDPEKIRRFVGENEKVIAKPFSPTIWKTDEADYVNRTAIVPRATLPSDDVLACCPVILQKYVQKSFEVRVTAFGTAFVGAYLDSQADAKSAIDWRSISPTRLGVRQITLPTAVERKCAIFMQQLDLLFGCFDFVVTPTGEWVFLECNQMGQFLWIEEVNPDLPLLDMFIQLLVADDLPRCVRRQFGLALSDVVVEARDRLATERAETATRINNIVSDV